MRASVLLATVALLGCDRSNPPNTVRPEPGARGTNVPHLTDGEDVIAQVRGHNGEAHPVPREFRAGNVTPRQLDASAIQRTGTGFRVRLPSGAPIVTPTVHRGLILTSGGFHSRELYAFHARTGELAWAISLDDDGPSTAACEGEVCVFNTESCTLFAVDSRNGRMLWSKWLGDPLMSAPAISDGIVYAAFPAPNGPEGDTHVLGAFDLRTGAMRWGRWIDSDVMSAPVITHGRVYAASFAGTLYELAPRSGEILAAHRARATSAPIVADGELAYTRRTDAAGSGQVREGLARQRGARTVVSSERHAAWLDSRVQSGSQYAQRGAALDGQNGFSGGAPAQANATAASGNIGRGNVSTLQAYQGSRAVSARGALYSTLGDRIVCSDREGNERWNVRLTGDLARSGGALGASPALAGGFLFVATLDGKVLQIDPRSGAVRRRYEVGGPLRSQPAIVDGWIYAGTEDGQLVAIDTRDRSLNGWSTWGANAARTGHPQGG